MNIIRTSKRRSFLIFVIISMKIAFGLGEPENELSNQQLFNESTNESNIKPPKPMLLMHGLALSANSMEYIALKIKEHRPDTKIYNPNLFPFFKSFLPLQEQLDGGLTRLFREICAENPEGFHVVAHSQGALLLRVLIQNFPNHTVHNFISLAGILEGQYGIPTFISPLAFLGMFKPLLEFASAFFYTPEAQKTLSVANFWHDPFKLALYMTENTFLPHYDEEKETFKEAIKRLKMLVCIMGPNDSIAMPWQTGDFSYLNAQGIIENCTDRAIYEAFGLRELDETGRFKRYIFPHVEHFEFLVHDYIIQNAIIKYLD